MISVLYFDDETGLLEIGKLFLERIGTISVDIANFARDALNQLASASYDVIVSDYQMPGMDGIEFLRKIRMNSDIPFIFFTGRSREEGVITALNGGVDYYIQKGGNPNALFAALSHNIHLIVKHEKAEAELRREQGFSSALLDGLSLVLKICIVWKSSHALLQNQLSDFVIRDRIDNPNLPGSMNDQKGASERESGSQGL